jgi:hypothetical protein
MSTSYNDYLKTSIGIAALPTQDQPVLAVDEIPGDLGQLGVSEELANISVQAVQQSRGLNVPSQSNCRYRGPREAVKFNLLAQSVLWLAAQVKLTLQPVEEEIETKLDNIYPSDDDIASVRHAVAQLRFLEFLKLKGSNVRWFA